MKALLLSVTLALPAAAQEQRLDPEILVDRLVGQTMAFVDPRGALIGHERFLTRDRTLWRGSDGLCAKGAVSVDDTAICFRYDNAPQTAYCWLPFEDGAALGYRATISGEVQMIEAAPRATLDCASDLLS